MQPAIGPVSQEFGTNPHFSWQPWGHLGRDYALPIGSGLVAIAPGTVVWADWSSKIPKHLADLWMQVFGSPASGICVIIQHDGWCSMYAHLDSTHLYHKSLLHRASVVQRGDSVGKSGNTGNSTGPHLHFECFLAPSPATAPFGRYDPRLQIAHEDKQAALAAVKPAPTLTPTQRKVVSGGVNELDKPSTATGKVLRTFPAGEVLNFKGYVLGERVDGMNGWLVGAHSGKYFHIGRFTQQDVRGLPNLTPPPPKPANWRKTGSAAAAYRVLPYLSDDVDVLHYLKPNIDYVIDAWTTGDEWEGSNVWFSVKNSDGWTNAKLFTSQSTAGIPRVNAPARPVVPKPVPDPVPVPKPTPTPVEPPYSFAKAVPCVTGVYPAAKNKFRRGGIPVVPPADLFLHQFMASTPEENPEMNRENVHISSVTNTFTEEDDRIASAHFAVEGREIRQYVDLADRAYHAGTVGNDSWGIEIYGMLDEESLASVALLISQLEDKFDRSFNLRKHNEVMATLCGRHIDLEYIRELVFDLQTPPLPPVVETPEDLRDILVARVTETIDNTLKEGL